jgi:hypothetical protein
MPLLVNDSTTRRFFWARAVRPWPGSRRQSAGFVCRNGVRKGKSVRNLFAKAMKSGKVPDTFPLFFSAFQFLDGSRRAATAPAGS